MTCRAMLLGLLLASPAAAQIEVDPVGPSAPQLRYEQRTHLALARLAFETLPAGPLRDELAADAMSLLGEDTGFACSGADDSGDSLLEGAWEEDCNFHYLRHFWHPDSDQGLFGAEDSRSYGEGLYRGAVATYLAGDRAAAWYELGRVLHLLQDLANPAHVHLDPHGSADPRNNFEALTDELFESLLDDGELDGIGPLDPFDLAPTPCPPGFAASPKQAQPLFRLFLFLAETSDNFESGDVAGQVDCAGGGETAAEFATRTGHPAGMAPPATGAFTAEHLETHADVLLPLAIRAGAGLLELFWSDTHVDSDGDGLLDGVDPCPDEAVDDADGDGACAGARYQAPLTRADDRCPLEATLVEEGACGCLHPGDPGDADGDGVPDCLDLCVEVADPGQEDSDRDGIGDACLFRLELGDGAGESGSEGVDLPLTASLGVGCLHSASFRAGYDAVRTSFLGVVPAAGCEASATEVSPGELDLSLSCAAGVSGEAELLTLQMQVALPVDQHELVSIALSGGVATDCGGDPVALALRGASITVGCAALGDVDGDGVVDLRDLRAARAEQAGHCLDLAPVSRTCVPRVGAASDCPEGDGLFDDADRLALRALVAGIARSACETCASEPSGGELRLMGDLAPAGGGDGVRDVSDVLRLLRFVVGLEIPSGEERLRGDLDGDGRLDVADVLALLRQVVQLDSIDWPERELVLALDAPATLSAWSLRVVGLPSWARASSFSSASCPASPFGGLDASGNAAAITCAPAAPAALSGDVATLRYLAPEALDPARLLVESRALDAAGSTFPAAFSLH